MTPTAEYFRTNKTLKSLAIGLVVFLLPKPDDQHFVYILFHSNLIV
jgi:hypothetical protein